MKRHGVTKATGLIGSLLIFVIGGCLDTSESKGEVIRLGLMAPLNAPVPELADASASFERVAQAAVDEINSHGGVDGYELVLIIRGDIFPPSPYITEVIEELDNLGVVGAIGPVITPTTEIAWPAAKEHEFPLISPSSTAGSLADVEDGGFLFRNVTNDRIQGLVMAYSITDYFDDPSTLQEVDPLDCVYVLHQDDSYGGDFAAAFTEVFRAQQHKVFGPIEFGKGSITNPDQDPQPARDLINSVMALDPCDAGDRDALRNVILISLDDVSNIVRGWDQMQPKPNIRWFFTDGARTPGFLDVAPSSVLNMVGTSPTNPILGDAYEELDKAYRDRYNGNIAELVFSSQVWDGVFLFAAALTLQFQDTPYSELGGAGLVQALRDVSTGPGVILHAGQWRDMLAAIKSGVPVDFDGASGPNDFDACGETIGPYEFWQLVEGNDGGVSFSQLEFFDTRELSRQLATLMQDTTVKELQSKCPEALMP